MDPLLNSKIKDQQARPVADSSTVPPARPIQPLGAKTRSQQVQSSANRASSRDFAMSENSVSESIQSQPQTQPKKGNKILVTVLVAIICLAVGLAVGTFVIAPLINDTPEVYNTSDAVPTEETVEPVINDNLEDDLSKKVSYLTFTDQSQDSDSVSSYATLVSKFINNELSDEEKLYAVLYSLENKFTTSDVQLDNGTNYTSYISSDEVNKRYQDLFGVDAPSDIEDVSAGCPVYHYDQETNAYYTFDGCGGVSGYSDLIYKSDYKVEDNKAYVEIKVGSVFLDLENEQAGAVIYNNLYESEDKKAVKTLADFETAEDLANYIITEEESDLFTSYTVVFTQDSDGNFVFDSVE